ncbi:MAG: hypothetical protein ABI990_11800 [Actinomycetota bacterium]
MLLHAARRRGLGDAPFLDGAVFMANSASLLLPGSNLTNLVVLAHEHISGARFATRLARAWAVAVVLTIAFVAIVFRSSLISTASDASAPTAFRLRALAAVAAAAVLVLVLPRPALPVLALGIAASLTAGVGARAARSVRPTRSCCSACSASRSHSARSRERATSGTCSRTPGAGRRRG